MDYTAKIIKGLHEIIENQKKLRKQNSAILAELKKNNCILEKVHGYYPNVIIEEDEDV